MLTWILVQVVFLYQRQLCIYWLSKDPSHMREKQASGSCVSTERAGRLLRHGRTLVTYGSWTGSSVNL
jgi:hypothetical protein